MAYEKQNFVDGQVLTADQMNHIEDGIAKVESQVANVNQGNLPGVTTDDTGKLLQVVDGVWTAVDDTQRVTDIVNSVLEEALGGDY